MWGSEQHDNRQEDKKQQLRDLEIERAAEAPVIGGETLEEVVKRQKLRDVQEPLVEDRPDTKGHATERLGGPQSVVDPTNQLPNLDAEEDVVKERISGALHSNQERAEWDGFFSAKLPALQQAHPNLHPAQYRELLWTEWKSGSIESDYNLEATKRKGESEDQRDMDITNTDNTATKPLPATEPQAQLHEGLFTAQQQRQSSPVREERNDVEMDTPFDGKMKTHTDFIEDEKRHESVVNQHVYERSALHKQFPMLSDEQLNDISKKELIDLLQSHASQEFKVSHNINGVPKNVAKKLRRDDLVTIYRELEDTLGGGPVS